MDRAKPAVVVSSPAPVASAVALGRENYSYSFAIKQFRPLLARWGETREVNQPESRVEFSVRRFRQGGYEPLHLGFSPLHAAYLARDARNAAFVFWEYPDLPLRGTADDPRYDWTAVANRFDCVFTASTFSRDAFRRAGVTTPIEVVPVPVAPAWFDVPRWQPDQSVALETACYEYPLPFDTPHVAVPGAPPPKVKVGRLKAAYRACVKPLLPTPLLRRIQRQLDAFLKPPVPQVDGIAVPVPQRPRLDLSGVVYLHVCNLFDFRKNWEDLMAAFIDGLGDREDATLVLKLVADGSYLAHAVNAVNSYYLDLGRTHKCKIALVGGYLSDAQMRDLFRASTYYATATRAEGANLPLMDALAAGRPALSPRHTSMLDYYTADLGWVIPSEAEPATVGVGTEWLDSSWHRVDVAGLAGQFRESYQVARGEPARYRELSSAARERMREYASAERVWPRFRDALAAATGGTP